MTIYMTNQNHGNDIFSLYTALLLEPNMPKIRTNIWTKENLKRKQTAAKGLTCL